MYDKLYLVYNFHISFIVRFAAGTNTHSVDLRKSAGGFIHGFRYTGNGTFFFYFKL